MIPLIIATLVLVYSCSLLATAVVVLRASKVRGTPDLWLKGLLYWLGGGLTLGIVTFFIPEWIGSGLSLQEALMFGVFIALDLIVGLSLWRLSSASS